IEAAEIARQRRLAAVESEALFTAESAEAEGLRGMTGAGDQGRSTADVDVARLPGGGGAPLQVLLAPGSGRVINKFGSPLSGGGSVGWGGGYHWVWAGRDRGPAERGQSGRAGAPVGGMPDERRSASELYFEVREQGGPVDPTRWMRTKTG